MKTDYGMYVLTSVPIEGDSMGKPVVRTYQTESQLCYELLGTASVEKAKEWMEQHDEYQWFDELVCTGMYKTDFNIITLQYIRSNLTIEDGAVRCSTGLDNVKYRFFGGLSV